MDQRNFFVGAARQQKGPRLLPLLLGAAAAVVCLPRLTGFVAGLVGATPSALRGAPRYAALKDAAAAAEGAAEEVAAAAAAGLEDAREGTVNALEQRERQESKEQLINLVEDTGLLEEVMTPEGKPLRGRVDEAIGRVERFSPTREPVYSELLDGEWRVKFSGSYAPGLFQSPTRELALFLYAGGFSPGNALNSFSSGFWGKFLGVKAENYRVNIRGGGSDVESFAEITTFGEKKEVSYRAELMPLSANRMSEEILSLDLPSPIGKQEPPLSLRRQLLVSYLDEDMMIVRDESGVADVLVRDARPASGVSGGSATAEASGTSQQAAGADEVAAAVEASVDSGAA